MHSIVIVSAPDVLSSAVILYLFTVSVPNVTMSLTVKTSASVTEITVCPTAYKAEVVVTASL